MLSHTPVSPSTTQAFEPTPASSFGLPSLAIDPWRPSAPPRQWTWIVIHHTATSHGSVESINATHLQRRDRNGNPWKGIGYHFVIGNGNGMEDGEIEPTFRWRGQLSGAHAGDDEHNQHGIGIALVGNFELAPPSPAQMTAVRRLVTVLRARYGIETSNVLRHGDIKATACPGKYFPMGDLTQRRMDPLAGNSMPPSGLIPVAAQEGNRP
jgi:N-acetylmuramoyl-L-alanine amidase